MMLKKGVCKNFENCTLADNQETQEVDSSEFICAECGKPLYEVKGPKPPFPPKWLKLVIAVLIIAGLATGGYFLFRSCSNSKVRITVVSENETMGTVKGSGKYEHNKIITIEANANEGYRFVSWDDKNTKNPREILTKEDGTYTAKFGPVPSLPVLVTIKVESSDETMGTVTGGGTYDSMITISIEAIANKGYEFDSWNDGNIENPRKVITGRDETYVAKFKKKSGGGTGNGTGTKQYSFGKYVGELKNGIPEGDGKMYYSRRVQIAKHDTTKPPHYAEKGDYFVGQWNNGDIQVGVLYDEKGNIKKEINAPGREWPYDIELEKYK